MRIKTGLAALVLGFSAGNAGAQTIAYREVGYSFEKGGGVSFLEILSAPNPLIRAGIETQMKRYVLGEAGDIKSFEQLKKHASDKVNPLMAGELKECDRAENQNSVNLYEAFGVVSLTNSEVGYFCGAHGAESYTAVTFDITTGKELDLADLFKPGFEQAFCALGEQKMREWTTDGQTLAEAGYDGFADGVKLAKNWYIDPSGIAFVYNRYEAGPWVMPPPDFSLTFDEIRGYIRSDGPLAAALTVAAGNTYQGTIGDKYKIVFHIAGDSALTGWYYYESQGERKKIVLTGTREGSEAVLTETVGGKATGTFSLSLSADGMQAKGIWKGSNGKLWSVHLTRK